MDDEGTMQEVARLGFLWMRGVATPEELAQLRELCAPIAEAEIELEEWSARNAAKLKRMEAEMSWKDLTEKASTERVQNVVRNFSEQLVKAYRQGKLDQAEASERGANASQTASSEMVGAPLPLNPSNPHI
jgi:hypothetical protein